VPVAISRGRSIALDQLEANILSAFPQRLHAHLAQVFLACHDGQEVVARPIEDRHFPQGRLVLATLRGRQLPVIAHAFAQHVLTALRGA
jgi:hypothetical protein